MRAAATTEAGTTGRVAVRAFIGRSVCGRMTALVKSPLYLRHPDMQPNVHEFMAPSAHFSSSSLKTIVFLARIRTR
jgi:hypothetical protein